eukprot:TRINITY_DN47144_c0_g1_i1.p1 TRINITY_DN47144_c0_g1~~TRINITY_DN47144_c0_g1_i1.p1  ORF type:complete len:584 (+),score=179.70 TRINITY_DN47144_c0_g1_i1:81-1754(+)
MRALRRPHRISPHARAITSVLNNLELLPVRRDEGASRARRTTVICTVGPRGDDPAHLAELIRAGMGVMRLNMSHSEPLDAGPRVAALRGLLSAPRSEAPVPPTALSGSALERRVIPVAIDLKGPEIRTGVVAGGGAALIHPGQLVELTTDPAHRDGCTAERIYVDYADLCGTLARRGAGARVFIDDGLIQLDVEEVGEGAVRCRAHNGGELGSRKGVNLPGCAVSLPAVSEKDLTDLRFAAESGCDLVFASFVRNAAQVQEIRAALRGFGGAGIGVIAKIENQEGLDNVGEILAASDGIMVARGDLGIEIAPEEVVRAQKHVIARAMVSAKPVICATQMLESMVVNPRPTRAEVSDVGNAVIDGADCVMLSGETAKGAYPRETAETMSRVCILAEELVDRAALSAQLREAMRRSSLHSEWTLAWAEAAVSASFSYASPLIVCLALTSRTARLIASMRPRARVLMPAPSPELCAAAMMHSGLEPLLCPELGFDARKSADGSAIERHVVARAIEYGRRRGYCRAGDTVIACHNEYDAKGKATSVLRFVHVPEVWDPELR